ncbi:Uncharacterised protein [Legionella cherrii]|uniref:Uncharacterized protein n=1 Tax=Legionella cherrii TaxID=28084 RepID=A0ABY6T162_9GAMM|nr:Uncharacterised protein [Legionella cherrii]
MTSVNPVVYSQINLQAWQKELPSIELQISETVQLIEKQRHLLKPYQEELRALNARISWKSTRLCRVRGLSLTLCIRQIMIVLKHFVFVQS